MPPNKEESAFDICIAAEPSLVMAPIMDAVSSEGSLSIDSDSDDSIVAVDVMEMFNRISLPVEQTLKDILLKVTEKENLEEVTEVKLRVIAADISLQYLHLYTPFLRELDLDGSVLSSLRDLGCGLVNLKLLRVCRCGLTSLDGMFGLESLEEIYAGHNQLENLNQCTCLPEVKVIDVRRNCLKNISTIGCLTLCEQLRHLVLDGNYNVTCTENYRKEVKKILPGLVSLDEEMYLEDDGFEEPSDFEDLEEEIEDEEPNKSLTLTETSPISFGGGSNPTRESFFPPIDPNGNRPQSNTGNDSIRSMIISIGRPETGRAQTGRPQSGRPQTGRAQTAREPIVVDIRELEGWSRNPVDGSIVLPRIMNGRSSPGSHLTSGAPLHGNVAVALRNRARRAQEAWVEREE